MTGLFLVKLLCGAALGSVSLAVSAVVMLPSDDQFDRMPTAVRAAALGLLLLLVATIVLLFVLP